MRPSEPPEAAAVQAAWALDPAELETLASVAEEAVVPRFLVKGGAYAWSATSVALDGRWLAWESRRSCGEQFQREIGTTCEYAVEMVAARDGSEGWHISYARGRPLPSMMGQEDELGCARFAACVARGRLGHALPIPDSVTEDRVGLRHQLSASPMPDSMRDPDTVREWIASKDETIDELREQLAQGDDPRVRHHLSDFEQSRAYLQKWLDELEAAQDEEEDANSPG